MSYKKIKIFFGESLISRFFSRNKCDRCSYLYSNIELLSK